MVIECVMTWHVPDGLRKPASAVNEQLTDTWTLRCDH